MSLYFDTETGQIVMSIPAEETPWPETDILEAVSFAVSVRGVEGRESASERHGEERKGHGKLLQAIWNVPYAELEQRVARHYKKQWDSKSILGPYGIGGNHFFKGIK